MKKDFYNLNVTAKSDEALDQINHFNQQFISGKSTEFIIAAAENQPDSLLLQCYAAVFNLYAQVESATLKAKQYLQNSESLLHNANQREKMFYQAICAWQKLDYELALTLLTAQIDLWPRDCTAAKIAEWLFYCTGQRNQAKQFLRMCNKMRKHNLNNSYFLAMFAFAQELCGKYDQAHEVATRALEIEPTTAWAHHALGHVYLMRSEIDTGISAFESFKPTWENIIAPLKSHNTWHLALFYLANLDRQKINALYIDGILAKAASLVSIELNAISLLWRMEMAGLACDKQWQLLIPYLQHQVFDHYMPFNNFHFMYALARAGDDQAVVQALKKLDLYAISQTGEKYRLWYTISKPFLHGCVAFTKQNYKQASKYFHPIIEQIFCVGGSDAQDEVFLQTYYISLKKSGQHQLARKFFKKYLSHYTNTKLGKYWDSL